MYSSIARYAVFAASLIVSANAVESIVAPDTIAAGSNFQVTFQEANSDKYRVYLAAALTGINGPACYLLNSTSLHSPITLSIPASVGPSADYYSIAIADLTASQGATYSNHFNFTGGTGNYTEYEQHLGGAPFWDANDLPCSDFACARKCAAASYPDDLTSDAPYETMKSCMLECPGVTPAASQTAPAHATKTSSDGTASSTTNASGAATSSSSAMRQEVGVVGVAGALGLAALVL